MVLLPKVIFVFLNVILDIPRLVFNKLQSELNRFIWGRKRVRIKASILQRTEEGGMAVPSITMYYQAALLVASLDWYQFAPDNHRIIEC